MGIGQKHRKIKKLIMAFKMRSGNTTSFKKMGSSPYKVANDADGDGIPDTVDRDAGDGSGKARTAPAPKSSPKMDNAKWKAGSDAAKKNTGRSLNELVAARKGLEKGSNEYNKIQNSINKALGNSKRYDVKPDAPAAAAASGDGSKTNKITGRTKTTTTDKDPNTGADRTTKTTTRKDGTTARIKSETDDKKSVSRINRDGDKQTNVVKTGRSTDTKKDDVKTKTKIRGGDEPTQTTRTRTADTVTKTETDLKTGDSTSKSRKRLGKGLIKDVVAKGKARRNTRKANKAKASKAAAANTQKAADALEKDVAASAMKNMKTGKYKQSFAKKKK